MHRHKKCYPLFLEPSNFIYETIIKSPSQNAKVQYHIRESSQADFNVIRISEDVVILPLISNLIN